MRSIQEACHSSKSSENCNGHSCDHCNQTCEAEHSSTKVNNSCACHRHMNVIKNGSDMTSGGHHNEADITSQQNMDSFLSSGYTSGESEGNGGFEKERDEDQSSDRVDSDYFLSDAFHNNDDDFILNQDADSDEYPDGPGEMICTWSNDKPKGLASRISFGKLDDLLLDRWGKCKDECNQACADDEKEKKLPSPQSNSDETQNTKGPLRSLSKILRRVTM